MGINIQVAMGYKGQVESGGPQRWSHIIPSGGPLVELSLP